MEENAGAAQARALLGALYQQLADISDKLETAERHDRPTSIRGATLYRRHQSAMRRDLYEAHRLIDGLHRRFPETLDSSPVQQASAGRSPTFAVR